MEATAALSGQWKKDGEQVSSSLFKLPCFVSLFRWGRRLYGAGLHLISWDLKMIMDQVVFHD